MSGLNRPAPKKKKRAATAGGSSSDQLKAMLAQLKETQEAHGERVEDKGGNQWNIFTEPVIKMAEGTFAFDIIPYICGDHNPYNAKGKLDYMFDVWVHADIGASKSSVICPAKTYHKNANPNHQRPRCPICELATKLDRSGEYEWKDLKPLRPIRRCAYNVLVADDTGKPDGQMQILFMAHFNMEKNLQARAAATANRPRIYYPDINEGKQIVVVREGAGKDNTAFTGHGFEERVGYSIDPAMINEAFCLDELVTIYSYDELKEMLAEGNPMNIELDSVEEVESNTAFDEVDESEDDVPIDVGKGRPTFDDSVEEDGVEEAEELECPFDGAVFGNDYDAFDECETCTIFDQCKVANEGAEPPAPTPKKKPRPKKKTGLQR